LFLVLVEIPILVLRGGLQVAEAPLEEAVEAFLGLLAAHRFLRALKDS
jgi:genome maintenance exonuclease 1